VYADSVITFVKRSVESVTITNAPAANLEIDDTQQLGATVAPADASVKAVAWSVAAGDAVTVSDAGLVKAVKAGTATVRAASTDDASKFGEVTITVNGASVWLTGISVSGGVSAVKVGETSTAAFTVAVAPANATVQSYTLEVIESGAGRAAVGADGKITGLAPGSVIVQASIRDARGAYAAYTPVSVLPAGGALVGAGSVQTEVLVIYENFGGVNPSEGDITPQTWPAVHSDSGKSGGWYTVSSGFKITNTGDFPMPFPGSLVGTQNEFIFHIDSIAKFRTGGIGVNTQANTNSWLYPIQLRNGYKTGENATTSTTTATARFHNVGAFPEFKSLISYDTVASPLWNSANRADETGYLVFGKQISGEWPVIEIPSGSDYLTNISRMEALISGTRVNRYQVLMVRIVHLDDDGFASGTDTLTYSVASTPRLVSIPVKNGERVKIFFSARGDGNNNNIMDINTGLPGNTGIVEPYTHNREVNSFSGNPNVMLHMLKVYAKIDAAGYTLTLNGGATASKASGIAHDEAVTVTAPAANADNAAFAGWKITGRPDLSEVANPLSISVTENLTLTPVYAGDEVEVPVVNETFTSWPAFYEPDNNADGRGTRYGLIRVSGSAMFSAAPDMAKVKVPLRYGYTNGSSDSVGITLHNVNVVPDRTIRAHNAPGAEKWTGYLHFFGPAAGNKGYVKVDTLAGITKVEVEVSSYDNPTQYNRAVAIEVNGEVKRNKMLQTMYAEQVGLSTEGQPSVSLLVGYGNQAQAEYLKTAAGAPDPSYSNIKTTLSPASIALHSLKMYAKIPAPVLPYYDLKLSYDAEGGNVFAAPEAGNSTGSYLAGTVVTLRAIPAIGFGFDGWKDASGAILGMDATLSVPMDAAKDITAVFAQNPSYITVNIADTARGGITFSTEPEGVEGNTYTFLAGVPVTLTATPEYCYRADVSKWTVAGGSATGTKAQSGLNSTLAFAAGDMVKDATLTVSFEFDTITTSKTFTVVSDTAQGKAAFDPTPLSATYTSASTLEATFPEGVSVTLSAEPAYSYTIDTMFAGAQRGKVFNATGSGSGIVMSKDTTAFLTWKKLPYRLLVIVNEDPYGTVEINDPHSDFSDNERSNRYPQDYWVTLKINASSGYWMNFVGGGANSLQEGDDVLKVRMDTDTVTVIPEFTELEEGVVVMMRENFQNAQRWPQSSGTVSNAVAARLNLNKSDAWPVNLSSSLETLLADLAAYRDDEDKWGDGPKTPTLEWTPYYQIKIPAVGSSKDSVTVTVGNGAPCNDCLPSKAVKRANIAQHYLGHVTPGNLALKKPAVTTRSSVGVGVQPFIDNDTVGAMIIDGMAYVDKLEIGYSSSASPSAPSIYYNTDGSAYIDEQGRFHGDLSSMKQKGDLARFALSPYNGGDYGWSASKEGMIMDQHLSIAVAGVEQTQIVILPWFNKGAGENAVFSYDQIFLHDLWIRGSAKQISDVTAITSEAASQPSRSVFYLLGSTNVLKADVPEPIKALVLYNEVGTCIGVYRGAAVNNQITINGLRPGVYGVHAYTVDGKTYRGGFIKVNNN
jgi:hypothetical protein